MAQDEGRKRISGKTEITNTAPQGEPYNKLLDGDLMLVEHIVKSEFDPQNPPAPVDADRSVKLSELRTYVTAILRQELQNGTLVVKKAECDEGGSNISDRFDDVEDDIDTLNSNDSTTGSVANKIKTAINALDVSSQGGAGKYIQSISETDGKISATAQTMDTSPTANSTKAVTSGGVKTALDGKLNTSLKGANSGLAELDANGIVPQSQLPSYVDDVLEYSSKSAFPENGETGKIYVSTNDNKTYRWSGSVYVEISPSLALGETSSTAYRGDRGKIAYAHSQATSGNPHNVTKSDVGLGNVDNTSDANKPVSTATQTALDNKVDKVTGKGLSTNDFTNDYKNSLDGGAPVIYCTCSTAGATAIKELTPVNSAYKLQVGSIVAVKFTYTNSASNVKLKLDTTEYPIYFSTAVYTSNSNNICGYAGKVFYYQYDGTNMVYMGNNSQDGDYKVGQYNSETDADFRVLLSTNATKNSETNTVKKSEDLTFNPSTKVLKVNNKSVRNADTAIGMQAVTCTTAGNVAEKTVELAGFTLFKGARLNIYLQNKNTVTGVTLNVNDTGAKTVKIGGGNVTTSNFGVDYWHCYYDGTNWQLTTTKEVYNAYTCDTAILAYYSRQAGGCGTEGQYAEKVVSLSGFTLDYPNATFALWFQYANTYQGKLTLKVNGQTAKDLYINGTISSATNCTLPNGVWMCTWDGDHFNIITDYMYGDTFTASGANAKKGLVPQPPATAGTTKYLREDGTWAVPSGGGVGGGAVYCTCATDASTAVKVVTSSVATTLQAGTIIGVKFSYSNTASNCKLQFNGTNYNIYYNNAVYAGNDKAICGYANRVSYYFFDGTNFVFMCNGVTATYAKYLGDETSSMSYNELDNTLTDMQNDIDDMLVAQGSFTSGNLLKSDGDNDVMDSGIRASNVATLSGTQTITGNKTFSGQVMFSKPPIIPVGTPSSYTDGMIWIE